MMGRKVLFSFAPALALIGVWAGVALGGGHIVDRKLEVTSGRTTVGFYSDVLSADKVQVGWNSTAEGDPNRNEPTHGFAIDASNMKFSVHGVTADQFNGSLSFKGGFSLMSPGHKVDATGFSIDLNGTTGDKLELVVNSPKGAFAAFDLRHSGAAYSPADKLLLIGNLDMVMTADCARALGEPDLAGKMVGFLKIFGDCDPIDGLGDVAAPSQPRTGPPPTGLDLMLSDMGGISYLGRVGTFPNGTNALTCYTTSCNAGTVNIRWDQPMATTHPGIIINLYRLKNGRLEQIGTSWVKHGFLATNFSDGRCGTCHDPAGAFLGLGCSDTYGGSNNDDQFYIGGRDEWNPTTGVWTCQNSYFSNYMNDCVRRNNGSGLSVIDHRLTALDADLGNAGATYYYEARYITQEPDVNAYNNLASRSCSMTWTGSSWSFSTTDAAELLGPTINRYGDMRDFAAPRSEGDVIVAVTATNLGTGFWHYEYAVYNHNLDRQVKQFSIPVPVGATIQNVDFRDIDQDTTNQWTSSVAGGTLTWSTTTNAIKYGTLYNFRFDANVQPMTSTATLTQLKSGSNGPLTANTEGPLVLSPVLSYQPFNDVVVSGNLQSLAASDDDSLVLGPSPLGSASGMGITTSTNGPTGAISKITLGVESSDNLPGTVQTIDLWNWTTSAWENVDSRATTSSDSTALLTITSNPGRFVNSSTGEVRSKILHSNGAFQTSGRRVSFDQVGFHFN